MGVENFITFMLTALVFVITPGIDTVFVLNKSVGQGRKSGMYAALGINIGVLTHTLFAAMGLSMFLSKSEMVFVVIKYLGVVYLVYLGVLKLKNNKETIKVINENKQNKYRVNDFWSGFITNTLNPKVALFFMAFFPQFINPTQIDKPLPFILLGITFAIIGTIWYLGLSFFACSFSQKMTSNPNFSFWLNTVSGFLFILMGFKIMCS